MMTVKTTEVLTKFFRETKLLSLVDKPKDVVGLSCEDFQALAAEIRSVIIEQVSVNGGHLAPSLGVVELTLALCRVFDLEYDKLVWDVGHQSYAYKLLTGRMGRFHSLRKFGGLSGFPCIVESPFDHFGVGHSSTSISAALGMALARDLAGRTHEVVAVIGDGSLTAGLAFEALNQAGDMGNKLVVVLNDNEMSISKNVGALSRFLSRKLSTPLFTRFKREVEAFLKQIPKIGEELALFARRSEDAFKSFMTPGMLFEALRFTYVGPIDGHNLDLLCEVLTQTKHMDRPVLVHVLTCKGKGYTPAETNPTYFHGVGGFEPETGIAIKHGPEPFATYTEVFGSTLCALAEKDKKVVAITAAMPEGTGTDCFRMRFPDRFVDVGICEQHAVTFAAGLATQGFKPAVAIYSTFLQRAYDQVVHDVCLQNLNVKFFLDRAGLVGEDGATHHGAFDISYMRHIPNIVLMAPKDEDELARMISTAFALEGPVAVRYPRGMGVGASVDPALRPIALGQAEILRKGKDVAIIAIGSRVLPALEAAEELEQAGVGSVAVCNARFIKPLPSEQIISLARQYKKFLVVEESVMAGGFGSAVLELLADHDLLSGCTVRRLGLPDIFVGHGSQKELLEFIGIDKNGIKKALAKLC